MSQNKNYKYTLWAPQDSHMIARRLEVKFAVCCDLWDESKSTMGNDPMLQVAAPLTEKIWMAALNHKSSAKSEDPELELAPKWVRFYSVYRKRWSTASASKLKVQAVVTRWSHMDCVGAQEVKGQRAEHGCLRNANIKNH